jgi:hypothetical protein
MAVVSDAAITWQLVNPEGASRPISVRPAQRPATLEGKTVGLAWNGKPGGDDALDEIAALLEQRVNQIRFIRYWDVLPESVSQRELSEDVIRRMAAWQPDVVIVSQAD